MLSLFPLHFLSLLAYFLLRIVVGIIALFMGSALLARSGTHNKVLGSLLTLAGTQFVLGFYTQVASLILATLMFLGGVKPSLFPGKPRSFFLLMWAVAVSLFITGAGAFAFDLPI